MRAKRRKGFFPLETTVFDRYRLRISFKFVIFGIDLTSLIIWLFTTRDVAVSVSRQRGRSHPGQKTTRRWGSVPRCLAGFRACRSSRPTICPVCPRDPETAPILPSIRPPRRTSNLRRKRTGTRHFRSRVRTPHCCRRVHSDRLGGSIRSRQRSKRLASCLGRHYQDPPLSSRSIGQEDRRRRRLRMKGKQEEIGKGLEREPP